MAEGRLRYGIVGAGWIAQERLMPAVAQTGNSVMTALVTGDPEKGRALAERYGIASVRDYDGYRALLASGEIDALYIALPNDQHRDFAVPALEAGLHVLLEKPMAVSEAECREIEAAAAAGSARLMIAYRLHFEPATLETLRMVRSGLIGEPRLFTCSFSQHVSAQNHRARHGFWAGPVADMGPYPINAARALFGAEPVEVSAIGTRNPALGFDIDDTVAVTLRFPDWQLAQFTVSYGANGTAEYRITGTEGDVSVEPGFNFGSAITVRTTIGKTTEVRDYPETDQFGGELAYFSDCVLSGRDPEPDGEEGRLDVRVVAAVERALRDGRPQQLAPARRHRQIDLAGAATLPPLRPPPLVNASAPGDG